MAVDVVCDEPTVVGQRLAARRQVVERELRESTGDALPAERGIHHGVPDHHAAVPQLVDDRSDDLVPDRRVVAVGIGAVADDYAAVHVPLSSPVTLPDPSQNTGQLAI